jgi:two-component system, OmpR family, phosphate regulon sensor histidine kinase PhoR
MTASFVATALSALSRLKDRLGRSTPHRTPPIALDRAPITTKTPEDAHYAGILPIIDALPDAALVLDARLNLLHGNTLARTQLGALYIGEHISRTARSPALAAALAQAYSSHQRVDFELILRGRVERRLEGAATALSRRDGTPSAPALLVILQDLSERDALARMRVEFVANASHELRTPLASLSGFIETLRGPAKNDLAAREKFLEIMTEQAERMTRLVDDLLTLSRVEMRAHVTPTTVVNLNLILADTVKMLTPSALAAGATLVSRPAPEEVYVHGDHDELVQAVQNLIQNALKYGRSKGTVTVAVQSITSSPARGSRSVISVSDDGPGIPPEHLPRLTERFYRANTVANRNKTGTGLGLAIVKHIAARHHGTLEIASTVGQGSQFRLVLPAITTVPKT